MVKKKRRNWLRLLRHNYDFDFGYLLDIEKEKLKDMLKYFKKTKYIDATFIVRDLTLCIKLLNLYNDSNPRPVNIRNAKRFFNSIQLNMLKDTTPKAWCHGGINLSDIAKEELYRKKVWHLYCLIREYRTTTWWD